MYKYQTKNNGKKLTKKLQKNQVHGLCERHKHSANPRIWGKKELNKNYKRIPKQNLLVYQITCVLITKYTIWQKVVPRTQRVFFFGNLFWPTVRKKKFYWSRKTFEIRGWRPRMSKSFEITRSIYSNSERSVQFLKHNTFLTSSRLLVWKHVNVSSNWILCGFRV